VHRRLQLPPRERRQPLHRPGHQRPPPQVVDTDKIKSDVAGELTKMKQDVSNQIVASSNTTQNQLTGLVNTSISKLAEKLVGSKPT